MAQNSLGTVQQELGIDPQSAEYFRKALDDEGKENAGWAYRVAASYSYGVGVPQDYAEAVRWWRIAISSVDLDCQNGFAHYMLGHAYHNGHGVPKDYVLAYMWYALAVEYSQYWHKPDEPEVKKRAESRDGVARKLAPQQLEEARRLAQQEAELDGHPDLNFTLGS
ncbi:MAG TPA: hypothetical protein VLM42_03375 [Bryobacteraceae bacterium]|nr:hypothetical protein [Bryobacteraceae bacterium]